MNRKHELEIRKYATQFLRTFCERTGRPWPPTMESVVDLVKFPIEEAAVVVLGVSVESGLRMGDAPPGAEIGGAIDRSLMLVTAGEWLPYEVRRFTLAHEVGHWLLHPALRQFRERAIDGSRRTAEGKPLEEQEADDFAGHVLMHELIVQPVFDFLYGGPIRSATVSQEVIYGLRPEGQHTIDVARFRIARLEEKALWIASNTMVRGNPVPPLHRVFGLSRVAAAIQLERLQYVT